MAISRRLMETEEENIFFIMATSSTEDPNLLHIHWVPQITSPSRDTDCLKTPHSVSKHMMDIAFHQSSSTWYLTATCTKQVDVTVRLYRLVFSRLLCRNAATRHQLYWIKLLLSFSLPPENASFQILSKSAVINHSSVVMGWSEKQPASWNKHMRTESTIVPTLVKVI